MFGFNRSCNFAILFLLVGNSIRYGVSQEQNLIFGQSTVPQPIPTQLITTLMTPAPTTGMCQCVPFGTCTTAVVGGIDIRIVNTGNLNCGTGLQYCCSNSMGNNSGLTDGTCGLRKIPLVAQQPGTASYGAYPWQAALLTSSNLYIGAGVLINPTTILTVAHKVSGYSAGGFKVRLGEWDAQTVSEQYPYQEYMVAQVIVHPSFNAQNLQNDVALVRLSSSVPVSTSPAINTICQTNSVPTTGTRCWVSGWGKNAFGATGSYQSILKEVDVPLLDQNDCENRLRGTRLGQFFTLSRTSFLCAGGEANKDACTGDGGSPLVCEVQGRWQLVGLVAWGIGCATSGVPGVYVHVPNFSAWISQQLNQFG